MNRIKISIIAVFALITLSCSYKTIGRFDYLETHGLNSQALPIITGKVVSMESNEGVSNACIAVNERNCVVLTDTTGFFSIRLSEGSYVLRFKKVGEINTRMTKELIVSRGDSIHVSALLPLHRL